MRALITEARQAYHQSLADSGVWVCSVRTRKKTDESRWVPNNADNDNPLSVAIAMGIYRRIHGAPEEGSLPAGQTSGSAFEKITREFLRATFLQLGHIRPGDWQLEHGEQAISAFEQYAHLRELQTEAQRNKEIAVLLGQDYLIKPDIVIARRPVTDAQINSSHQTVDSISSRLTPLRAENSTGVLLHASVSCKWTLRSDRAQNARSEALNLIRLRKGRTPHIVVVTAEPLPSRLASLALGTGDLDCVYHFALPELRSSVDEVAPLSPAAQELDSLVRSKRLRDISDLPLDLAI